MNCPRCGKPLYARWVANGVTVNFCVPCEERAEAEHRDRIRDAVERATGKKITTREHHHDET